MQGEKVPLRAPKACYDIPEVPEKVVKSFKSYFFETDSKAIDAAKKDAEAAATTSYSRSLQAKRKAKAEKADKMFSLAFAKSKMKEKTRDTFREGRGLKALPSAFSKQGMSY